MTLFSAVVLGGMVFLIGLAMGYGVGVTRAVGMMRER